MKVVFLVHYFPPLNSSGARRINAFAKYLAATGHQITVITTRKTGRDGLLTEDVPSYLTLLELGGWGKLASTEANANTRAANQRTVATRSLAGQLLLKIKRSFMKVGGQLIDHRLLFSMQFAFPWLAGEVKQAIKEADIVMSSCPPWPTHLAGRLAKTRFGRRWVADYRDQFSGNHILRGSALSRPIEVGLERWLIKTADHVVAISGPMKEYYELFHPAVTCIENGYDEGVFEMARARIGDQAAKAAADEFVIRYMGTITVDRIPVAFFQALAQINQQPGRRVVAEFYGESTLLRNALPEVAPQAEPFVRFCPQLPYMGAIQGMLTADALFFIETSDFSSHSARGVLTTKLFEYLAARKPVVAEITARSLAAQYIRQSGLGVVVSEDTAEILRGLERLRAGEFKPEIDDEFINSLSRQVKAQELEQLFHRLVGKTEQAAA
ncbi:MAG: glycosyltransferase [Hylemonella sp.]|nr:glycosyltransferase [Hylemonella sp.]